MSVLQLFSSLLGFLLRGVVVKFVVLSAVVALVGFLVPLVLEQAMPFVDVGAELTSLFDDVPAGVWFFVDAFRLDVGLPLLISAHVARFLIRRLPVIG